MDEKGSLIERLIASLSGDDIDTDLLRAAGMTMIKHRIEIDAGSMPLFEKAALFALAMSVIENANEYVDFYKATEDQAFDTAEAVRLAVVGTRVIQAIVTHVVNEMGCSVDDAYIMILDTFELVV